MEETTLLKTPKPQQVISEAGMANNANQPFQALQAFQTFLSENGLTNNHQSSALYQTYEDLRHVRKWRQVRIVKTAARVYLAGRAPAAYDSVFPNRQQDEQGDDANLHQDDCMQIVVPMPACAMLSPLELQAICDQCVLPGSGRKARCVTAAFVDDDSTTAYYRVFSDLAEFLSPHWKVRRTERRPRRSRRTGGKSVNIELENNSDDDHHIGDDASDTD